MRNGYDNWMKIHVRARAHTQNDREKKSVPNEGKGGRWDKDATIVSVIAYLAYTQLRSGRHRQSNAQHSLPPIFIHDHSLDEDFGALMICSIIRNENSRKDLSNGRDVLAAEKKNLAGYFTIR